MPQNVLSWNEIEHRATTFVTDWKGETYEKGESQSFWSDFLQIFGIDRRRHGAFFEYPVKKLGNKQGFIDMFWPGMLLAEQKSAGRDLSAANTQAFDYLHGLKDEDLPQYIIVSDFGNFELVNLETREKTGFTLEQLPKKMKLFGFLIGRETQNPQEEDPVNRQAAETMARLHNQLRDSNYSGHELELLLVRLMFCLFADDAAIFERGSFEQYLRQRTGQDGSDLGGKLAKIFEVLNTSEDQRQTALDQDLIALPYVNGGLFAEFTRLPDFTGEMRAELLTACGLDWSQVSPAIFGSMFQGVMDEKARRNLGAHYTSERNIMKIIRPLFLDSLHEEFDKIVRSRSKARLEQFHDKLAGLKFLDPACGCGNFLVVTYRELRKLEHRVLDKLYKGQTGLLDVGEHGLGVVKCDVDQMNGIEIEEFPALIAETALWLTDHQMNLAYSQQASRMFVRLPLNKRANIVHDNALTADWAEVVAPGELDYILGNPPFNGSKFMSETQRAQLVAQFTDTQSTVAVKGAGILDFVCAWYAKAAHYMVANPAIETALVSTNSITQGEQVGVVWKYLLSQGIHINFAHQTFKWSNEGKGVAAVYCVIIGFSLTNRKDKRLFVYPDIKGEPEELRPGNINPYLVDAPDVVVTSRSRPISQDAPRIRFGNQPIDGGHFILNADERAAAIQAEPFIEPYIRPFVGSRELINGQKRYCLWLKNIDPHILRSSTFIVKRVERVRQFRLASERKETNNLAAIPTMFAFTIQTDVPFIAIPSVSSVNRRYIPMSFFEAETIASNLCLIIPNAKLYHFGLLNSAMHMAWVRAVCGRLKSDYRYSNSIVYNNFPWPRNLSEKEVDQITVLSQNILAVRAQFPQSVLADLYDIHSMPALLTQAHMKLDNYIDLMYKIQKSSADNVRITKLFNMYKEST